MQLPEAFIESTKKLFGEELFAKYLAAFDEQVPVSIRINPYKSENIPLWDDCTPVPWCKYGYYLKERPEFIFDPLLHAGYYYVQEASSMFLAQVMQQYVKGDVRMLDLCAAPGGKSTCARSFLSPDSTLICNEPIKTRANILYENITKFGAPNTIVTNNYPSDFEGESFDVILADVPCSGEGMFRKDEATIGEWSEQNVEKCWRLQREIITDIWKCLKDNGVLIYSTCTFNTKEDEENVRWICEDLGAEVLSVDIEEGWGITHSLLKDWDEPVCRFIPGMTKGEGLFMAVLRKTSSDSTYKKKKGGKLRVITEESLVKCSSVAEALSANIDCGKYATAELPYEDALSYLHREAIVLPKDAPKGLVLVTYKNAPLGFVKNIGNRANNLYPKEWAIKKQLPS